LEHFRKTGETGWQFKNPFPEVDIIWGIENKKPDNSIEQKVKEISIAQHSVNSVI